MRTRMMLAVLLAVCAIAPAASQAPRRVLVPRGQDAIGSFAAALQVGKPRGHGNLTLFPVSAPGAAAPDVDLTLDKAMKMDVIEVEELKSAEVNRLRIYNRAKRPVFVMAGEMLRGGKQDRIAEDDLVIPPRTELTIPVFCVEHGRWAGRESGFSVGHSLAGAGVRGAGRAGGQSAVWSKVEESQERLRAPSPTGALRSVHDSEEVRARMRPYLRAFDDFLADNPRAGGVVVAIGNEIAVADLFGSPALLRQMWDELLEAYVIDALEREYGGRAPDAVAVKKWLSGIGGADREEKDTPGDGRLYELRGRRMAGTALVYEGGIVHMGLFGEPSISKEDHDPLRFRRDRMEEGRPPRGYR